MNLPVILIEIFDMFEPQWYQAILFHVCSLINELPRRTEVITIQENAFQSSEDLPTAILSHFLSGKRGESLGTCHLSQFSRTCSCFKWTCACSNSERFLPLRHSRPIRFCSFNLSIHLSSWNDIEVWIQSSFSLFGDP